MASRSSIERLPKDILDALHELLRDPKVTQLDAAQRINALLEQSGNGERVSKSSVNRYSQRMDQIGDKMRQSRQIAEMWIGKLGNEPQGQVGKLLNEFTRTMAFETALTLSEGEDPVPPKMLKELALSIKHLEEASTVNEKREREIEERAREAMLEEQRKALEAMPNKGGVTAETKSAIREALGIKS